MDDFSPDDFWESRVQAALMIRLMVLLSALFLLVLVFNPFTQAWLAREYVLDEPLEPSDAMVALRGDAEEETARIAEARKLIEQHYAPVLLLDTDARPFYGHSPRQLLEEYLGREGFPQQQMRSCENSADSTAEEAAALRFCFEKMGFHKVTVVTSEYHTRRARFIFRRVFSGSPIQIRFHAVYNPEYWDPHWWRKRRWAKTTVQEALKFAWTFLERSGLQHQSPPEQVHASSCFTPACN